MNDVKKVELLLKDVTYLDVKAREFKKGNIAINNGKIVGIDEECIADTEKDCTNLYLVPGFIDGHIHLESSMNFGTPSKNRCPFNISKI